jgi:hypothetical protein
MEYAVYIIIMILAYFVALATAPKPPKPRPPALEEIEFPQYEEGTPQEVIFGDCWTESWMVLGYGDYRTSEIRRKSGK